MEFFFQRNGEGGVQGAVRSESSDSLVFHDGSFAVGSERAARIDRGDDDGLFTRFTAPVFFDDAGQIIKSVDLSDTAERAE